MVLSSETIDLLSFYFFTFLLFYLLNSLFTLKYCCPIKTSSYGFREAGPLYETHCKPRSGAAVGGKDARAVPRRGTYASGGQQDV